MIFVFGEGHKKVFSGVPIIGFKNNINLKAHLVRSQLPNVKFLQFIYLHVYSKVNTYMRYALSKVNTFRSNM